MNFVDFLREIYSLAPIRSKRPALVLLTATANAGCKNAQDQNVDIEKKKATRTILHQPSYLVNSDSDQITLKSSESKKSTTKNSYAESMHQSTYMESSYDDDDYETNTEFSLSVKELNEKHKILKEAGSENPVGELMKFRKSKGGQYTIEDFTDLVTEKWTDYFKDKEWNYELPEKKEDETDRAYLMRIHQYFQNQEEDHKENSLLSSYSTSFRQGRALDDFDELKFQQQPAINEDNEEDQNDRRRKL